MPKVSFTTQNEWDEAYSVFVDGEILHYERRAMQYIMGDGPSLLASSLEGVGLQKSDIIIFIGSGFGWCAEKFIELGYSNCLNVDTSDWIQQNKLQHSVLPILNFDVLTSSGQNQIIAAAGRVADWAISEDVLPCLYDSECSLLSSSMHSIATNVVHLTSIAGVGIEQSSSMNWKTLEEWKSILPGDLFVQRGTDRIL